ncbi:hypothetical protein [Rhizobium sp. Leaf306]|uniref:hypothetical protein n=1 Tax=Rhizobium sp. Leaf306 TaxID=1736330 RepID=UPI000AA21505|nr:hypothetical protein [Rhizobium sp. Leaf306]
MSRARSDFIERVAAFKLALDVQHLIELAPTEVEHNTRARMLRNGLCVVGFTMLEDFIKSRADEVIEKVGQGPIAFSQLPERLQHLGTIDVLDGLRQQTRRMMSDKLDALPMVQHHSQQIASTVNAQFQLSFLGFGRDASNLNSTAVKGLLRTFQIKDGWGQIGHVGGRIGFGIPSMEQSFVNASKSRHAAAHEIRANTLLATLRTTINDAVAIALGYDLLLSKAIRTLLVGNTQFCQDNFNIQHTALSLRFVDQIGPSLWSCFPENAQRAWKRSANREQLIQDAESIALRRGEFVVLRDQRRLPTDWRTPGA